MDLRICVYFKFLISYNNFVGKRWCYCYFIYLEWFLIKIVYWLIGFELKWNFLSRGCFFFEFENFLELKEIRWDEVGINCLMVLGCLEGVFWVCNKLGILCFLCLNFRLDYVWLRGT